MGKLHELLAVEATVVQGADKLIGETNKKFGSHTEFFTGNIRKLERLNESPEDSAIEESQYRMKALPTNVPETVSYIAPFVASMLNTKLAKHMANQHAVADIMLDDVVLLSDVPVDFLLDMEKFLPKWRDLFARMPTLDPSRKWEVVSAGVWRAAETTNTSQTVKTMYPVVMQEATKEHPAQIKESNRDVVVGLFKQTDFSGAATSQQKADAMKLCDDLLVAVKKARMRANSVEVVMTNHAGTVLTGLFTDVFD